jgi:hypothetical protein
MTEKVQANSEKASVPAPAMKRRTGVTVALYLAMLGGAIFAAWQMHGAMSVGPSTPPAGMRAGALGDSSPASMPSTATAPAGLAANPLATVNLEPLSGDPAGIAPPAGAVRGNGYSRKLPEGEQQFATYDFPGSMDAAAEHYRRALLSADYTRAGDTRASAGRRVMSFVKNGDGATVDIRSAGSSGSKIVFVLVRTARK